MKKLMYFAAALLVLVGCNKKDNIVENTPEGTPFEKGQQVTLTVGAGAQQGPNRVAGVENTTDNQIDFKWEENDKILVKVGQKTAIFTLTTGEGTETGTFSGVMPASGTTFDIQYPTTTPDLSTQEYTALKTIPADKMLFTATGCTLGNTATLQAQYAMVQLNLYGTDKTVGKIVFTNKTADPAVSYTLTCTGGKTIGTTSAEATPLYMVVPTGTYLFEAEIWDNATTPAKICSFATSEAQTFTAGKCLNMPAKEVKAATPTVDPKDVFKEGAKMKFTFHNEAGDFSMTYTYNGTKFEIIEFIQLGIDVTSEWADQLPVTVTGAYSFHFEFGSSSLYIDVDADAKTYVNKVTGNADLTGLFVNGVDILDQLTEVTE